MCANNILQAVGLQKRSNFATNKSVLLLQYQVLN